MSKKKAPKDEDDLLLSSGMDLYIRALYRTPSFPSVDKNGCVYLKTKAGALGRDALKNRKSLYDGTPELAKHIWKRIRHCRSCWV
jgi:hypothetical protein